MLRNDPQTPLTIARAAEAVDASAMSLYRHFADRDDLVLAVTRYVMSEVHVDVPLDAPWPDRVRAWMVAVYDQAVAHPQLFQLIALDASAWLPDSVQLGTILATAGFTDERRLAEAIYFVATTTIGHAMITASLGDDLSLPKLYAGLSHLTPEQAERAAPLIPHFAAIGQGGFAVVVDFTIAALAGRGAGGSKFE